MRQPGFYWVLRTALDGYSEWIICQWNGECWRAPGDSHHFADTFWHRIDEQRIENHK